MATAKEIIAELAAEHMPRPAHNMFANQVLRDLEAAGFKIVPIVPTEQMLDELARIGDGPMIEGAEVWGYMLAAASATELAAAKGSGT